MRRKKTPVPSVPINIQNDSRALIALHIFTAQIRITGDDAKAVERAFDIADEFIKVWSQEVGRPTVKTEGLA